MAPCYWKTRQVKQENFMVPINNESKLTNNSINAHVLASEIAQIVDEVVIASSNNRWGIYFIPWRTLCMIFHRISTYQNFMCNKIGG
uniref:Uncharacterized protein n=1 Tax=Oryza meridionalis TaxID=40149 RepID=A0A0E0EES3_9ORYZ